MSAIHRCLAPWLPGAQPLHLATALWSYAAVGTQAAWLDELLLQARRHPAWLDALPLGRLVCLRPGMAGGCCGHVHPGGLQHPEPRAWG